MFPFTPKYIEQAKLYLRESGKLLAYRKDVVSAGVLESVKAEMEALKALLKTRDKAAVEAQMERLDQACRGLQAGHPPSAWRENVEVFVVAISIALGVRTYFVQPFTIPTGSMQPTLNGIISVCTELPQPNPAVRLFEWAALGRSYFDVVAERDETISAVRESHWLGIPLSAFTYTVLETDKGKYSLNVPKSALAGEKRCAPGRQVAKGDVLARGHTTTGDHVLVDKFSYHFVHPAASNVFVFNTAKIMTHENVYNPGAPSQFYIKRIAGIGGDSLRIDPPVLFRNGAPATEAPFLRVMAGTLRDPVNGYRGYSNGPERASFPLLGNPKATVNVPKDSFFALGDNSYHSSDSRDWGWVPQNNVVGRGWLVYWPFSRHWGVVR
ncbi:MAG: signal peptidase I [Verrucomicrobia bacterium]|nr:signal peptidase I [Verrucomicrobiota bacterium]